MKLSSTTCKRCKVSSIVNLCLLLFNPEKSECDASAMPTASNDQINCGPTSAGDVSEIPNNVSTTESTIGNAIFVMLSKHFA